MTCALSLSLSLSLSLALASVAAPAHAAEPTVAIDVDVSALPDEDMTRWLKAHLIDQQVRILEDGGLEVVENGDATFRVTVTRYGELGTHYRVTVALFQGDGETPTAERTLTCEHCRDDEVVTKVAEEVARMSGRLIYEPPDEQRTEQPTGPASDDGTQAPVGGDSPEPPRRRIGVAGYTGIAALPIGVGLVIGGVIALTKEPSIVVPPDRTLVERVTTHRRLGAGLTAAGVGASLTGVVLLIVDQTVLRKRRSRGRGATVLLPSAFPVGFGVSLAGRF